MVLEEPKKTIDILQAQLPDLRMNSITFITAVSSRATDQHTEWFECCGSKLYALVGTAAADGASVLHLQSLLDKITAANMGFKSHYLQNASRFLATMTQEQPAESPVVPKRRLFTISSDEATKYFEEQRYIQKKTRIQRLADTSGSTPAQGRDFLISRAIEEGSGFESGLGPSSVAFETPTSMPNFDNPKAKHSVFIWCVDETLMLQTSLTTAKTEYATISNADLLSLQEPLENYNSILDSIATKYLGSSEIDTSGIVSSQVEIHAGKWSTLSTPLEPLLKLLRSYYDPADFKALVEPVVSTSTVRSLLARVDAVSGSWMSVAKEAAECGAFGSGGTNVAVSSSSFVKLLSGILLSGISHVFSFDALYSSSSCPFETLLSKIVDKFGLECSYFVISSSSKGVPVAHTLRTTPGLKIEDIVVTTLEDLAGVRDDINRGAL